MPVSLVATVLNESSSIAALLDSILAQERLPDEVVIVDGGSRDGTLEALRSYAGRLPLQTIEAPGCNISQGRNRAIAAAQGEIIAVTDGGVRLDPRWLSELVGPATQGAIACGFFVPDARGTFEVALGATVLPAVAEIDPRRFLPSSRSVAFPKEAWQRVGGYPENLDYCEDLVFDLRLRQAGYPLAWVPQAIAHFRPRPSLAAFFRQYYRYARGDGKANLWLGRHVARYTAYLWALLVLGASIAGAWTTPIWAAMAVGGAYYVYRPYRRLWPWLPGLPWRDRLGAVFYVPLIRLTGDVAKMVGYPVGLWWRLRNTVTA